MHPSLSRTAPVLTLKVLHSGNLLRPWKTGMIGHLKMQPLWVGPTIYINPVCGLNMKLSDQWDASKHYPRKTPFSPLPLPGKCLGYPAGDTHLAQMHQPIARHGVRPAWPEELPSTAQPSPSFCFWSADPWFKQTVFVFSWCVCVFQHYHGNRQLVYACVLSRFSRVRLIATLWTPG